jgi:large subunit ribosomal protein L29
MKALELRGMTYTELQEELDNEKEALFNLRFQLATNQLDNTSELKQVRKNIARILTVMREQEIAEYFRRQSEEEE